MGRPYYVVFAGVNGAGKSTLFRSGLWRSREMPKTMGRVNPDEIIQELGLNSASAADQFAAGKAALRRIDGFLDGGESFSQETTLAGRLSLRTIERARQRGYQVHLYYVGLNNADIALERIAHRVAVGGHDIDSDAVRRRFESSLKGLSRAIGLCETVTVYDNTRRFTCLAQWGRGSLSWWGNPKVDGPWLAGAMTDEGWRCGR